MCNQSYLHNKVKTSMKMLQRILVNMSANNRVSLPVQAIIIGALLTIVIYPDVVLRGATVSNYGQHSAHLNGLSHTELYLERYGRSYHHGLNDSGGAIWQSEPMQQFMTWVLRNGESPYWNRFSGAGSVGPETLVDQKFSPFTILLAIAGGSTTAFHLIWFLLNSLAISSLFYVFVRFFTVSRLAALAGCVVYALNGYNIAQLNSNVSQVYLYFPALLLTLCSYAAHPKVLRFVALIGACLLVFATTFLPVSMLTFVTVYSLAIGFSVSHCIRHEHRIIRYVFPVLSVQVGAALVAFLMLAILYFPIIESFPILKSLSMYKERVFYPASLNNLIALFTPKHFWESYSAIDPSLWSDKSSNYIGNVVFHFGIVPVTVTAAVLTVRFQWRATLVYMAFSILVVALGRVFNVPIISDVIGQIYMFGNIGEQYWWTVIAIVFPVLVAFGFDGIKCNRSGWIPIITVFLIVVLCLIYTGFTYDVPGAGRIVAAVVYVVMAISFVLAAASVIYHLKNSEGESKLMYRFTLLFLIFAELTFYMNHYRYERSDYFENPPKDVQFLREHLGDYRIANYGWRGVPPEYGAAYQIAQIGSMNMNILPTYLTFYQRVFLPDPSQRWGQFVTLHNARDIIPSESDVMFDMMGVKYVLISPAWKKQAEALIKRGYSEVFQTSYISIFENNDVFPRIYAVTRLERGEHTPELLGYSPRDVALTMDDNLLELAKEYGVGLTSVEWGDITIADSVVTLAEYKNTYLQATVDLEQSAVVVLMDNWHPNWRAFVDGKEVYLGLVNESFRGVVMPAGRHILEMEYAPRTLNLAYAVSLLMVLSILLLLFFHRRIDELLTSSHPIISV